MRERQDEFLCGVCGHIVTGYSTPQCVNALCYCQCLGERDNPNPATEEPVDRNPPRNPPTLVARCYLHPDYQGIRRPKVDCKGCRTVYSDRGRLKMVVVS